MHPIERLRYVARAGGVDLPLLVREAAGALSGFADDPAALVTACRSLVDRHPAAGPIWWLAARCLVSPDPVTEAWLCSEEIEDDTTAHALALALPEESLVSMVGRPDAVTAALRKRGDCAALAIETAGGGGGWGRRQARGRAALDLVEVSESGLGAAVACSSVVLLEAQALGDGGFVAVAGARAAAAVGRTAGIPVWVVAGTGRVLPAPLFGSLAGRLGESPSPWDEPDELVPLDLVDIVVRPDGALDVATALADPDCPFAPELLRPLDAPGSR